MAASASTTQSARPLADLSGTILLAGAGKMGGALLEGWLALGLAPRNIVVIEPAPAGHLTALADRGVRLNPPRDADRRGRRRGGRGQAAGGARGHAGARAVGGRQRPWSCRSWRAGRLRFLEAALPGAALIRAMPNTPAAIGRGITVAVANARVSREQRALVHTLLSAVGAVEWAPTRR